MFRFLIKPRWLLFTLMIALLAGLMVNLGFWQLRRLEERRAFNALVMARSTADPQPLDPTWIGPNAKPDEVEWRIVALSGKYGRDTISVAAAGSYQLVSAFGDTTSGLQVLVNRGSIGVTADLPPVPQSDSQLVGRVRRVPTNLDGRGSTTYVELISSTPSDAAGITPIPLPTLDEGPHLSYAMQWFIFAGCAVVGWLLAVRRTARSRRPGLAGLRSKQKAVPWDR
jgi:cytochrome oxidase assembly protein ShyY1